MKRFLRQTFGLWPMLEARNRLTMGLGGVKFKRLEDREVARLSADVPWQADANIACVIPTFRRHKGLVAAIASVLAQRRSDFVIVVVDDGGGLPLDLPDDPRLHAVSLSVNTKVLGLVRNVGIRLSKSNFIAFLDDDNTWTSDHLSVTLEALENGADLAYTAVRRRREDGTVMDILSRPFDRKKFSDESSWVDSNAIVLRRSVTPAFSRLPRNKQTLPKEDWEFVWRASRRARVVHVPEVTVDYLVNSGSYYTPWSP